MYRSVLVLFLAATASLLPVAGQYLAACVFYEALFAKNVVGNTFLPAEMDRDYGRFLQETAHRAGHLSRPAK